MNILKRILMEYQIQQNELAKLTGISESRISRLANCSDFNNQCRISEWNKIKLVIGIDK